MWCTFFPSGWGCTICCSFHVMCTHPINGFSNKFFFRYTLPARSMVWIAQSPVVVTFSWPMCLPNRGRCPLLVPCTLRSNKIDVIMTWQYDQIYFSLYRPWLILCCSYCRWLALGTAIWPNSSRLTFKMSRILTCCWSPLMVRPFTLNMHHIKTAIKQYKTSQLGFIQLSNSTMLFKQGA